MVPGIKNMIFGGDGIFLAQLVGPGTVWLQTLPISRLAHQIAHYLPGPGREVPQTAGAGLIGGIVGSILSGGE
jgi:biogenesis AIM24-like protein